MAETVVITGASRGIGRACALLFAKHGWNVAVNYLHSAAAAQSLVQALRESGGCACALAADVSDPHAANRMIAEAEAQLGHVDALVNNAGIARQALFTDITDEEWNRMVAVNLTGVFNCCRAVLPGMVRRKSGRIVNISSIWGIAGASCEVHYSAVKAGVIGLTKALAKEVGPSGITVNCVAPGVTDTDMLASFSSQDRAALAEDTPLQRLGTPEEIAQAVFFFAGGGADFITGQVLSPNGGFVI